MTLGPVFIIHGGSAQERVDTGKALIGSKTDAFPYWTETVDPTNGNLVLVFATNSREMWNVDARGMSCSVTGHDEAVSVTMPETVAMKKELPCAGDVSEEKNELESLSLPMTFGFSRYP